jgi:nitrogen fixation/metabolism regulation signal transduction histidine kinase
VIAVVALAVFTTHRLAGPWIAVRRALDRVRDGDLDTPLRIRTVDPYLREVERAFNEMRESLRRPAPGGPTSSA